jgi:hypothetical protein
MTLIILVPISLLHKQVIQGFCWFILIISLFVILLTHLLFLLLVWQAFLQSEGLFDIELSHFIIFLICDNQVLLKLNVFLLFYLHFLFLLLLYFLPIIDLLVVLDETLDDETVF